MTTKEENEKMLEFIEREEKPDNWFNSIQSLTPLIYTVAIGSVVNDMLAKSLTEYQEIKKKKLKSIKNPQKTSEKFSIPSKQVSEQLLSKISEN